MCYHVKMTERLDLVAKRLGLLPPRGNHQDLFTPEMHFNGFSFPWMPILTNSDPKQKKLGKWWLMQPWQQEFDAGAHNCLNTRIENVNKSQSVCNTYQNNRAVMIVDGFYEHQWQDTKGKNKRCFLMNRMKGDPFYLACLYTKWHYEDVKAEINTVTELTRPANKLMAEIHNSKKRMPVILDEEKAHKWLSGDLDIGFMKDGMEEYFSDYNLMYMPYDYNRPHIIRSH